VAELSVDPKNFRRSDTRGKQRIYKLAVAGRTHRDTAGPSIGRKELIFGRQRWTGHQPSVFRLRNHVVEKKLGGAPQDRVSAIGKESLVARVAKMLPKVRCCPYTTSDERAPLQTSSCGCEAPSIRVDVTDPS